MLIYNLIIRNLKTSKKVSNELYSKIKFRNSSKHFYSTIVKSEPNRDEHVANKDVFQFARKFENKILYSSIIESKKIKLGYKKNKGLEGKMRTERSKLEIQKEKIRLPLSLKFLENDNKNESNEIEVVNEIMTDPITQFPFESADRVVDSDLISKHETYDDEKIKTQVTDRLANYENIKDNWMKDYENYEDEDTETNDIWQLKYGTPDPKSSVSNVPCGGCGALLHCKDTAIPGYIPSEIFQNHKVREGQSLQSIICQRCHFLKFYDMALQVRVTAEDYPKILMKIRENPRALVILMVDVLDFPCSVWPDIINIIGNKRPVFVVGNKVDLLLQDSRGYLQRIKNIMKENVENLGLSRTNIVHVSLISAKTGYGVEDLITRLHSLWKFQGDVYLVGCTNVGKSTLFNSLLQSDYCKSQATDLIQRATTSIWPGTTLNLLKFPILRPSGWRLYVRAQRLKSLNHLRSEEDRLRKIQLRKTKNSKCAMLIGNHEKILKQLEKIVCKIMNNTYKIYCHIERTFSAEEPVTATKDLFSIQGNSNASGRVKIGIDENKEIYKSSRWCYDTPGVVHPAQILHLLTTEELMLTLPKEVIQPKTFSLKPGSTIFIAGLGRLDFITGPKSMRFTVFTSENLPITICETSNADEIYREFLGTEMFKVPVGNKERLSKWPALEAGDLITLKGQDWEVSCADVVLSNAGWISVTCGNDIECTLKGWTPEKRGLYIRNSILPKAVSLRGSRIRYSLAYKKTRFFVTQ